MYVTLIGFAGLIAGAGCNCVCAQYLARRRPASVAVKFFNHFDWAVEQPTLGAGRLIFLDETCATTDMTPTRGRSPKGRRCVGHAPYGYWRTTTLVCALSAQGLRASLVLDRPINGDAFGAWVGQFLAPELRPGGALWTAIGSLLDQFSSGECENYIRHCGYCKSG